MLIEKFLQWKLEYAKAQYLVLSKYTKWTTPFRSCRVALGWIPPKRTNSRRLKRAHLSEKILWDPKVHTVLPPLFAYQSILLDFKHLLILFLTVFSHPHSLCYWNASSQVTTLLSCLLSVCDPLSPTRDWLARVWLRLLTGERTAHEWPHHWRKWHPFPKAAHCL